MILTPQQAILVLNTLEKPNSPYPYQWDEHYSAWVVGRSGREWNDEREWFNDDEICVKASKAIDRVAQSEAFMDRVESFLDSKWGEFDFYCDLIKEPFDYKRPASVCKYENGTLRLVQTMSCAEAVLEAIELGFILEDPTEN